MTPTLRTERLILAPYLPEDEDNFVALLADPVVCRWMGQSAEPEEAIRVLFRRIFPEVYGTNLFDVWAVRADGEYVGHAEIKKTGNVDGHEIVCALMPNAWGKGYGTEITRCVMDYGFDVLKLAAVYGMVGAGNTASLALFRRLGFERIKSVSNDDGSTTYVLAAYASAPAR